MDWKLQQRACSVARDRPGDEQAGQRVVAEVPAQFNPKMTSLQRRACRHAVVLRT